MSEINEPIPLISKNDLSEEKKSKRAGREEAVKGAYRKYLTKVLFLSLLTWAWSGNNFGFTSISSFTMMIRPYVWSISLLYLFPFVIKRLRDLNHNGGWSIPVVFILFLKSFLTTRESASLLEPYIGEIEIPNYMIEPIIAFLFLMPFLIVLYLSFWPGTRGENQYGEANRNYHLIGNSWIILQKEFLSFQGRLSRKWFWGIYGVLCLQIYFFFESSLGASLVVVAKWGKLSFYGLPGFELLGAISLPIILILFTILISLVVRRVNDIGLPRWFGYFAGLGHFFLYCHLFWLGTRALALEKQKMPSEMLNLMLLYFAVIIGFFLILAVIPSQKGRNRYGENLVTKKLLPGENLAMADNHNLLKNE